MFHDPLGDPSRAGWPILVAFGSNIDPLPNLLQGLRRLHQAAGLRAVSTVYRTVALSDPHGVELPSKEEPAFLNGAVSLVRGLEPASLKQLLREIEREQKRVRHVQRYAPRTLDLDVALMGERVLATTLFTLPDPDIVHRPFLAIPLAELAPDLLHPVEKRSLSHIAAQFGASPEGMQVDSHATTLLQAIPQQEHPCD